MANTLFGSNVIYEDEESEKAWSSLAPDIQQFLIEQGAIPVASQDMFPNKAGMLSTAGKTDAGARALYKKYGIKPKMITNDGVMKYRTPFFTDMGVNVDEQPIERVRTVLSITDSGNNSASKIEEYLHYLDSVMGDTTTMDMKPENVASESLSEIMYSFIKEDNSLSKEELLEKFMNDSRTAHLDLNNPENKGLRTLLKDRLHHGGVVDVREGMGRYIAHALSDKEFKDWASKQPEPFDEYFSDPREIYANFARPDIKYTANEKVYEEQDRPYNLPAWLSKDLADSIATYINARVRE